MENKKNNELIWIIIILVIFVIGLVGYILYDKTQIKQINQNNEDVLEVEGNNEITEITDNNVIKKLNEKVKFLNYINNNNDSLSLLYKDNFLIKDVEEKDLLYYLVLALNIKLNTEATEEELKSVFENDTVRYATEDYSFSIDKKLVEESYYSLYGKKIINYNSINENLFCPKIAYSEKFDKYIGYSNCGEDCKNQSITYNYKYEEDNYNAYVYLSVATVNCENIYTDYNMQNIYSDYKENFELNSSNYQDFSKYKITFIKDGSDFHFSKIEIIDKK